MPKNVYIEDSSGSGLVLQKKMIESAGELAEVLQVANPAEIVTGKQHR